MTGTLTVLGCDGSYPGPGGAASGYLVASSETTVWLDAGPGTFARLQQSIDPTRVDAIVLTHEHPDHWTDLESFAVWQMLDRAARPEIHGQRSDPVKVFAPPGLRKRAACAEDPGLEWIDVMPSDRIAMGPELVARFVATDHGPPTLGVRFDRGGSEISSNALAYSADTGPDWSIEEFGMGIGTALVEATYTRAHEGTHRHLSGHQAGVLAQAALVGRLVLTHRWPTVSADEIMDEVTAVCDAPVLQAESGLCLEW